MTNSYEDMMGTAMDPGDHPATNMPKATQHYDGTQIADVTPLHPPGTFARNTQSGDVINGLAKDLGVKNPANVIKFPSRK